MAKRIRLIHDSYLARYVMNAYPWGSYRFNVRLGRPTDEISNGLRERYKGLSQNYLLKADCVVILPEKIVILEALVRPNEMWKMYQLNLYETAFRETEDYEAYKDYPIEKILLITDTNDLLEREAKRYGIKLVKWTTPDVEYYKGSLYKWQSTPRGSGLKTS